MSNPIVYTGTFQTMREVVDWINSFEPDPGTTIVIDPELTTGTLVATITVNETEYHLYAPNPTSVAIQQIQQTGKEIAVITINGIATSLYAPRGGGGSGSYFELDTYIDINGNTVEALYELDEISGSDPNWEVDTYTDINGNAVLALYEILEE